MAVPATNILTLDLEEKLTRVVREALKYAARKTASPHEETTLARLSAGDEWTLSYFVYALARNIAEFMGGVDQTIREAYVLGLEGDESSMISRPVLLVVNTARHTAALDTLVAAVEGALSECLESVLSPSVITGAALLDIQVVTEEEISARKGLGAAVASLWTPGLKVWQRS